MTLNRWRHAWNLLAVQRMSAAGVGAVTFARHCVAVCQNPTLALQQKSPQPAVASCRATTATERVEQERCLFLSLPHKPAKGTLAWEHGAWLRCRLDKQLVAFNSVVAPLFGAVPGFIPRGIDGGNEVATFDAVSATVRDKRLVQRSPFGVTHSALAVVGGHDSRHAALARQDQEALWLRSIDVLWRLVIDNRLKRNQLPVADKGIWFLR